MKQILSTLLLAFLSLTVHAQEDSLNAKIHELKARVNILQNQTEEVRRGQINYSIEKNLLKETYSNNYETINFVLTIVLGIVGLLGYLGIKDINLIKKEYSEELEKIRAIKSEFDTKSTYFDIEKSKFDSELKDIIKQNEEQNNKIRVLELKEKVNHLLKEKQYTTALEYCAIGLEIVPDETIFLNIKAIAKTRLNQLSEALEAFEKAIVIDPHNMVILSNYIECLLFANQIPQAKELIEMHTAHFQKKEDNRMLPFFHFIEQFHTQADNEFLDSAKSLLDLDNIELVVKKFKSWNVHDALSFAFYQPDTPKKKILQNILWYLDGQINAKTVCERLKIEVE